MKKDTTKSIEKMAKTVEMNMPMMAEVEHENVERIPYDELKANLDRALSMNEQYHQALMERNKVIEQMNNNLALARLDFCFKVISNYKAFDDSVIGKAINEITNSLFPDKDIEEDTERSN